MKDKGQVLPPHGFFSFPSAKMISWEDSGREEGNPSLNLRVSLWRQTESLFFLCVMFGNNKIFYDL